MSRARQSDEGLVDEAVAEPAVVVAVDLGQADTEAGKTAEGALLRHRLSVELSDPGGGTVGRNHEDAPLAIGGFGGSGQCAQKGRTAGDADGDRFVERLREAQSGEGCRAFVGDGVTDELGAHFEVVGQGRIAIARRDHHVAEAVRPH